MQYRILIAGIAIAAAGIGFGSTTAAAGNSFRASESRFECCVYHRGIGWLCCTPPMIAWVAPTPGGGGPG